jgi:hypothetical protein
MGLGCLAWLLVLIIVIIVFLVWLIHGYVFNYTPIYTTKQDYIKIIDIIQTPFSMAIGIKLENPYDKDTIIYASRGWYIDANGKQLYLYSVDDIPMYPEYKVLAAHQSIEYTLTFDNIPDIPDTVSLIMSPGIRINGISTKGITPQE